MKKETRENLDDLNPNKIQTLQKKQKVNSTLYFNLI